MSEHSTGRGRRGSGPVPHPNHPRAPQLLLPCSPHPRLTAGSSLCKRFCYLLCGFSQKRTILLSVKDKEVYRQGERTARVGVRASGSRRPRSHRPSGQCCEVLPTSPLPRFHRGTGQGISQTVTEIKTALLGGLTRFCK